MSRWVSRSRWFLTLCLPLLAPLSSCATGAEASRSAPHETQHKSAPAGGAPAAEPAAPSTPAPAPAPEETSTSDADRTNRVYEDAVGGVAADERPKDAPSRAASPAAGAGGEKRERSADRGGGGGARPRSHARPEEPAVEPAKRRPEPMVRPSSGGVKAGSADDNLQFNAFLGFLEANGHLALKSDVSQRVIAEVKDQDGLPLADAEVTAVDGGAVLLNRRTYADGRTLVFSSASPKLSGQGVMLRVRYRGKTEERPLLAGRSHRREFRMAIKRPAFQAVPLDIAFVLDTTGSMGDEIDRLKKTIDYINFQISSLTPRPEVRFGMVLFRDKGDDYRTRVVPFTSDVKHFRAQLNAVSAGGGGDTPEDVQEALRETLRTLKWRSEGAKLAFLVGDAPPHLDYGQTYTYVTAMQEAAERAIKLTAIGASGLDRRGEVVWRQLAQYTMAPFVFLTRGEKGDAEGSGSSVSHHVGSNWVAENLDAIIVRMVKTELAHYSPKGIAPTEDYFSAAYDDRVKPDAVMTDLFGQAVRQLVDYSVQRIAGRTPTIVLPTAAAASRLRTLAKKLETRLAVSLGQSPEFQLLESRDLSAVIRAQTEQLTVKYDSAQAVSLGKLLPAKLALISRIEEGGGQVEMLVKLVRLETGEILSLSLLKIDPKLL